MTRIHFHNEDVNYRIRQIALHRAWIAACVKSHGKELGDLNIIITSDVYLLDINKQYLNHNYFTDVITFDYGEGSLLAGDVFISIDTVRRNASAYAVRVGEELRRVMIHGVLHLAGFGDGSDEEKAMMRRMENDALHLWLNM